MKNLALYIAIALTTISCMDTPSQSQHPENHHSADSAIFQAAYEQYREPTLSHRRFKHKEVEPLILQRDTSLFTIEKLGESVEQRGIYRLHYGKGKTKVFLWSQMHGNESTATMALFDLFNFLEGKADGFDKIRQTLRERTSLYFIPMVNPDGAERFIRRNALDIDLNRDFREHASPESSILRQAAESIAPDFGFNLHDQQIYYNVPRTGTPATISVLAPAYNYERDINEVRGRAMQVIVGMNKFLQHYIPDGVAKYNDAHEPRGFGDNVQHLGASTILIESGGYKDDPEKQHIRKLNFLVILNSLLEIAKGDYDQHDKDDYEKIPENANKLCDLLIKNIGHSYNDYHYTVDLAIKRDEINAPDSGFFVRGRIDDVGDLKDSYGYEELDAKGLEFIPGKVYEQRFASITSLDSITVLDLLKQGYYAVRVSNATANTANPWPIVVLYKGNVTGNNPTMGSEASFFLGKGDKASYAVVNGYLIDLKEPLGKDYFNAVK